jgi:hypothetical protein
LRKAKGKPGAKSPGVFAFKMQSLRSRVSPAAEGVLYRKALQTTGRTTRIVIVTGGLAPTASGANSVASALHLRQGPTPNGRDQITTHSVTPGPKPELLTLHKTGTSHFALTSRDRAVWQQSRNVPFGKVEMSPPRATTFPPFPHPTLSGIASSRQGYPPAPKTRP